MKAKTTQLDALDQALAAEFGTPEQSSLESQVAELKAELKRVEGQRDASNRVIEQLTDEIAAKAIVIEELEARWEAAGQSIDHLTAMIQGQAAKIGEQRRQLEAMMAEYSALGSDHIRPQAALQERVEGQEGEEYAPVLFNPADFRSGLPSDVLIPMETGRYEGFRFIEHDPLGIDVVQVLQNAPDSASPLEADDPANTARPSGLRLSELAEKIARIGAENGVTGSLTVSELVTVAITLHDERIRLLRRIEELGGQPPKRDRAAYMRNYRATHKAVPRALDDGKVRFL